MTIGLAVAILILCALSAAIWLLYALVKQVQALQRQTSLTFRRIDCAELEESGLYLNDWIAGGPRTVVDQLLAEVALLRRDLARTNGALGYLRSYVWETRDPRFIDDVQKGRPSSSWGMQVKAPDSAEFRLWARDRDVDESVSRRSRKEDSRPRSSDG